MATPKCENESDLDKYTTSKIQGKRILKLEFSKKNGKEYFFIMLIVDFKWDVELRQSLPTNS
jgi:hypothetical protein